MCIKSCWILEGVRKNQCYGRIELTLDFFTDSPYNKGKKEITLAWRSKHRGKAAFWKVFCVFFVTIRRARLRRVKDWQSMVCGKIWEMVLGDSARG